MPMIMQAEAAECGLACMAMVAAAHGLRIDLTTLRRQFGLSLRGAGLRDLIALGAHLGLVARPLRIELEDLRRLRTPAILHWDMRHFVVLRAVGRSSVTICNPALGERRYSFADVSAHITGVVLELQPAEDFQAGDQRQRLRLRSLWAGASGIGGALLQILALSGLLQLFVLASPFYMQLVVDEALLKQDQDLVLVLALGFLLLTVVRVGTQTLRAWALLWVGQLLSLQLVTRLYRHLLRLPLGWFQKRHTGDVMSRFGSLDPVQQLFTQGLVATIIDSVMALVTLVALVIYSPVLTGVVLGAVVLYGLGRVVLYLPLRERTQEQIVASARAETHLIESLRAVQAIKIFGREGDRVTQWQNRQVEVINSGTAVATLGIGFSSLNSLLFGIENVLVIGLGSQAVLDGSFTIGMLYAFVAWKGQFADSMAALIDRAVELRMTGLHLERLGDIGLEAPESTEADGPLRRSAAGGLSCQGIRYRYAPGEPDVLRGIDLEVQPGELVVITGPSGSGKTTLLQVLMGLIEPTAGDLRIDGERLASFGLSDYRDGCAAVMQDDTLLEGSITDNISFFDPEPDLQRVRECAKDAVIDADVVAVPMGYDTLVGDMGTALSGGQRQRLLLARALYRRPRYLFLDEGTANLDADNARRVQERLRELGMTRIVVTHDPGGIAGADRVYVLVAGHLQQVAMSADAGAPVVPVADPDRPD